MFLLAFVFFIYKDSIYMLKTNKSFIFLCFYFCCGAANAVADCHDTAVYFFSMYAAILRGFCIIKNMTEICMAQCV